MCKFCDFLAHPTEISHWYDFAVVFQDKHFVAVPTIGCIVPGYLLIIPKRHVLSMAQLNNTEIENLILFTKSISDVLVEIWDYPIVYEHGACNEDDSGGVCRVGSCVDHAHWHLVPGKHDLLSKLPEHVKVRQIPSFRHFAATSFNNTAYLYYQDHDQKNFIIDYKNPEGQLLRRLLAECNNKEDKWDYLLFPELENIKETLDKIDRFKKNQS